MTRVRSPLGRTYRVTRGWLPWQSRTRAAMRWIDEALSPSLMELVWIFYLPLVPFWLVETLLQLLCVPFTTALRLVGALGSPIEIRERGSRISLEHARTWAEAGRRKQELVAKIGHGQPPPWLSDTEEQQRIEQVRHGQMEPGPSQWT